MTRDERVEELNAMRQAHPERLIAAYRAATNTPRLEQLPRGLGFTGMIEAILKHEFETEASYCPLPEVADIPAQVADIPAQIEDCQPITAETFDLVPQPNPCVLLVELRAFCSGAVMVLTGLLMAAIYLLMKHQAV